MPVSTEYAEALLSMRYPSYTVGLVTFVRAIHTGILRKQSGGYTPWNLWNICLAVSRWISSLKSSPFLAKMLSLCSMLCLAIMLKIMPA